MLLCADEPLPKAMGFKTKPSEETVVSSTQVKGIHDNGTVKHTVTTVTKTTIIQGEPTLFNGHGFTFASTFILCIVMQ